MFTIINKNNIERIPIVISFKFNYLLNKISIGMVPVTVKNKITFSSTFIENLFFFTV